MTFRERFHTLRLRAGLSPAEVARKVGVSPTCVWNWEQGNTWPRSHNLTALAAALGVSSSELTGSSSDLDTVPGLARTSADDGAETVEAILERAKGQIASSLKLPRTKIQISFSVST